VESHRAADGTEDSVAASQWFVHSVLEVEGPQADFEIADYARRHDAPWSESRLRTARAELVEQGLVYATGEHHLTRSKYQAMVWAIRAVA